MSALLFVTNGNGEIAIADRIAEELHAIAPSLEIEHLALVGRSRSHFMRDVGPQDVMPSGGLIAMGNVRNIVRDVRGGLVGLTLAQRRFLIDARGRYDRTVAVGDIFALVMTLATHAPTTYVGTAKSVRVAPYGPMERRILRRADQIFVRDPQTSQRLRTQGVASEAPGNVIVDLFDVPDDTRAEDAIAGFAPALAIFPGSREAAYDDAVFLADVVRRVAATRPQLGAVLSIAPLLQTERFEREFAQSWSVFPRSEDPLAFELCDGERTIVRAWRGGLGPVLRRVDVVIGQAGTANEAAAAAGVPVVALEHGSDRKTAWYRMRQSGLLGDALLVLQGSAGEAAERLGELLDDAPRRAHMGEIGRTMMGPSGGARNIAAAIAASLA